MSLPNESDKGFIEKIGIEVRKLEWEQIPDGSSLVFLYEESQLSIVTHEEELIRAEGLNYKKRYFLVPTCVLLQKMKERRAYQLITSALDKDLIL